MAWRGRNDPPFAELRETPRARKLFVELARHFDWSGGGDDDIRRLLVRALTEPWDRPGALSHAGARLIRSDPAIGPLVRADAAWPRRLCSRNCWAMPVLRPWQMMRC